MNNINIKKYKAHYRFFECAIYKFALYLITYLSENENCIKL